MTEGLGPEREGGPECLAPRPALSFCARLFAGLALPIEVGCCGRGLCWTLSHVRGPECHVPRQALWLYYGVATPGAPPGPWGQLVLLVLRCIGLTSPKTFV